MNLEDLRTRVSIVDRGSLSAAARAPAQAAGHLACASLEGVNLRRDPYLA